MGLSVFVYAEVPGNGIQILYCLARILIACTLPEPKKSLLRKVFRRFAVTDFKIAVTVNFIVLFFQIPDLVHVAVLKLLSLCITDVT